VKIPEALDGHEVTLQWDMGCEGLVWSHDGVPLQGLTGGCKEISSCTYILLTFFFLVADQARHEFIISKKAKANEVYLLYIEAACNGMFGVGASDSMVADPNRYFKLKQADLVVANKPVQDLYHDLTQVNKS
jgi:alpha-mannosidase